MIEGPKSAIRGDFSRHKQFHGPVIQHDMCCPTRMPIEPVWLLVWTEQTEPLMTRSTAEEEHFCPAPSFPVYLSPSHTVKSLKNLSKSVMSSYRRKPVSSVFKYFWFHPYRSGRDIIKGLTVTLHSDDSVTCSLEETNR